MRPWLHTFLTIALGGCSGLYIELVSKAMKDDLSAGGLWEGLLQLKWWNVLVVVAVSAAVAEFRLARTASQRLRSRRDELITDILRAACQSLIYPGTGKHIRAIVTLRKGSSESRITAYCVNTEGDPEQAATYPIHFGVTGEAYRTRTAVIAELPADHHVVYDQATRAVVLPQLRTILAAPIMAPREPQAEPLGVLAIDSTLPISKLKFNHDEVRHLAQRWADIIAVLLLVGED